MLTKGRRLKEITLPLFMIREKGPQMLHKRHSRARNKACELMFGITCLSLAGDKLGGVQDCEAVLFCY